MEWWILAGITIPLGWMVVRTSLFTLRALRESRAVAASAAGAADCIEEPLLCPEPSAPREPELARRVPEGRGGAAMLPQTFRPR